MCRTAVVTALLLLATVVVVVSASSSPVRCFLREYEWQNDTDAVFYIRGLDALSARPLLLALVDVTVAHTSVDRCVAAAHRVDMLALGWRFDGMPSTVAGVPFAHLPVRCADTAPLEFALSSLGAETWGAEPPSVKRVRSAAPYAPQYGRVDMLTASAPAGGVLQPSRTRTLTLSTTSHSVRVPVAPLLVQSCVLATELGDAPVDPRWRELLAVPRLLPLAECIRAYGGHCGVNLGYVMSGDAVNLSRHTDANRLHPASLENGFSLPETFTRGYHAPGAMTPHLHLGWPCDSAVRGNEEAKWHLDGYTLHLDALAERCFNSEDGMPAPGHLFSTPESVHESAHSSVDEDSTPPHALARRDDDCCACPDTCTDCDSWWGVLVFFGVLLAIPLVVLAIAWAYSYDWVDGPSYVFPDPHNPTVHRHYQSPHEYAALHGRYPPVDAVPASVYHAHTS